jgi:hypothetical protein
VKSYERIIIVRAPSHWVTQKRMACCLSPRCIDCGRDCIFHVVSNLKTFIDLRILCRVRHFCTSLKKQSRQGGAGFGREQHGHLNGVYSYRVIGLITKVMEIAGSPLGVRLNRRR